MDADLIRLRDEAHLFLDQLPGEKLVAVYHLLALPVEPLSVSLANAPLEDEEHSADTIASIKRGERCLELGPGVGAWSWGLELGPGFG